MKRRRLLVVTAGATVGLAGCLGGDGDGSDDGGDDSGPGPDNGTSDNGDDDNGTTDDGNDGNGTSDNGGAELEAVINWDPEEPAVGEEVTFDASGSTGDIAEYRWELNGDGEIETTGESASRTFDAEQRFSVALIVENVDGETNRSVATFDLREINLSADFVWTPPAPEKGEEITFDASPSAGDIVEYRWDFTGDGQFDATVTEPVTTYVFEDVEPTEVQLEIEDSTGQVASTVRDITPAQEVNADFELAPASPSVGEEVLLDASVSNGDIAEYRWDVNNDGASEITTAEATVSYEFESPGEQIIILTVENSSGDTDSFGRQITARLSFDWEPQRPEPEQEITFTFSPEANGITEEIVELNWDFTGDGEPDATGETVSHTFDDPGTKFVGVTVQTTERSLVTERAIQVGDAGSQGPVMWEPAQPSVGAEVEFSFDTDALGGNVTDIRWDFTGDGQPDATGETVSYTFDEPGTAPVVVEVAYESRETQSNTISIVITE